MLHRPSSTSDTTNLRADDLSGERPTGGIAQSTLPPETAGTIQRLHHGNCIICGHERASGFQVEYLPAGHDRVQASVTCPGVWEGYRGLVHGGIIASLLDGAMTHCLFTCGIVAVTADMHVRYRHPLRLHSPASVTAELSRESPPLYIVKSQIHQDQQLRATAVGKFMDMKVGKRGSSD